MVFGYQNLINDNTTSDFGSQKFKINNKTCTIKEWDESEGTNKPFVNFVLLINNKLKEINSDEQVMLYREESFCNPLIFILNNKLKKSLKIETTTGNTVYKQ